MLESDMARRASQLSHPETAPACDAALPAGAHLRQTLSASADKYVWLSNPVRRIL